MEWVKNQLVLAKSGDKSARRKLLVLAAAVVVATALLISGQSSSEPIKIKKTVRSNALITSTGFVHISGAVKSPGVYPISAGMRLFEVLALAGGFSPKADQGSVNLARTVTDGEQIIVSGGSGDRTEDGLIHINKATAADFDKLPGIGPTLSSRIIDFRKANGAFKRVEDLRKVGGIGDKLFAGIKQLVSL